jgi:hypothetical protein
MTPAPWPPFPAQPDRGQRRYRVSPERLREFAKLTPYQRLQWVEECATFVRLGQQAMARLDHRREPVPNEKLVFNR